MSSKYTWRSVLDCGWSRLFGTRIWLKFSITCFFLCFFHAGGTSVLWYRIKVPLVLHAFCDQRLELELSLYLTTKLEFTELILGWRLSIASNNKTITLEGASNAIRETWYAFGLLLSFGNVSFYAQTTLYSHHCLIESATFRSRTISKILTYNLGDFKCISS